MLALIALHAVAAVCAPWLVRLWGRNAFYVLAAVPGAVLVWAAAQSHAILEQPRSVVVPWVPGLSLELSFYLDTLSWALCLLVGGVGALVLLYCARYFKNTEPALGRFAGVLTAFAGAMFALVISDNMIVLFIAWELTTIFSYLMIGHYEDRKTSRRAALEALIVTTFGGLAMLGGMVMIGERLGTYRLSQVVASGEWQQWGSAPPVAISVAVVLVLLGALSKSALLPFHFWLPAAMAAPTPVSAYLHAAAMVKAGVFLVARLAPAMHDVPTWAPLIWTLGIATMLLGAYRALRQIDIKLMLAFGTVSQLGFLVVVNGLGTASSALAGLALLVSHALFKAPLFLTVGIIDKATGTRDVRQLSGVGRALPPVTAIAWVSALSMAGIPLTAGFVAKEAAFASLFYGGWQERTVLAFLVLGSGLTFAYSARFLWGALASKRTPGGRRVPPTSVRPVQVAFWLPAAVLAVGTLAFAVAASTVQAYLEPVAAWYVADPDHEPHLAFFAVNAVLAVSALSWALGVAVSAQARRAYKLQGAVAPEKRTWGKFVDIDRAYRRVMRGVDATAVSVTSATQRGSLPVFLGTTLVVMMTLVWGHLLAGWPQRMELRAWDHPAQFVIGVVVAFAAIAATRSRRRLRAVVLVGVTGFGVALNFVIFQAPDIALTQLLVETVTLVVFVLVLRRLPLYFSSRPLRSSRYIRLLIGVGTAATLCVTAIAVSNARVAEPVGRLLYEPSYAFGGGMNIVNVTLVDTRAWDTMGEISVVLVAATGVASLIFLRRREGTLARVSRADHHVAVWGDSSQPAHRYQGGSMNPAADARNRARTWLQAGSTLAPRRRSVVLEVTTRFLFPVAMLFSIFLLFAGHNRPGGGFIAALVTGLALMVRYLAGGRYELGEAFPVQAGAMLGAGLFTAVGTGLAPLAFGGTILQSAIIKFHLWPYGDVKVVTAMFFDIGVYLVVVGLMLDLLRTVGAEIDRQIEADTRAPVRTGIIDMREAGR
ncbi:Na+/H+ antiporter subunit A [Micrococcales bacterium 31B]|nr:Na+/H+ antiporter subunit A [Micrococcales bacterium 31B]